MSEIASDFIDGTLHPRENFDFFTNEKAEEELFYAIEQGRMHHAWIFNGPKGVGKATLAYRFARRYLGAKPSGESPLASVKSDIICQQITMGSCPDLRVATRYCPKDEKIKSVISVYAIRELITMFDLKANNLVGRRVAIIDCADELNDASANALLKTLEEPPKGAIIILIVNSMGAILPTIRSRCRVLNLQKSPIIEIKKNIKNADEATLVLSGGAIGRAKALINFEIDTKYNIISNALSTMPNTPLNAIYEVAKMGNNIENFNIIMDIIENWVMRAINASIGLSIDEIEPGESANMAKIFAENGAKRSYDIINKIKTIREQVEIHYDKTSAIIDTLNFMRQKLQK